MGLLRAAVGGVLVSLGFDGFGEKGGMLPSSFS